MDLETQLTGDRLVFAGRGGCGKSRLMDTLVAAGWAGVDGDDKHTDEGRDLILFGGKPLGADYVGAWMERIADDVRGFPAERNVAVACAAILRPDRAALRRLIPGVRIVLLVVATSVAFRRMQERPGHWYRPARPADTVVDLPGDDEPDVLVVDGRLPPELILHIAGTWMQQL